MKNSMKSNVHVTWKNVMARGNLGSNRGKGIFVKDISKKLKLEDLIYIKGKTKTKNNEIRTLLEPL